MLMVIFIILYFNITLPSPKSTSSLSPLFKHQGQQTTDTHILPTVRLLALQAAGDENSLIKEFSLSLRSRITKLTLPKTPFISLDIIRPWCALATINAP